MAGNWSKESTESVAKSALEALDLSLWGCTWDSMESGLMLSIYIDKEGGVNVGDCVAASRQIMAMFHVHLPEKLPFVWEVKSPGAERILLNREHYQWAKGRHIACRIKKSDGSGTRRRHGELVEIGDEGIVLKYPSGALGELSWQSITHGRAMLEDK